MKYIEGGVTAPVGFTANGVLSGIKSGRTKPDTALILSDTLCTAAGVFTQNRVQAEPVKLTRSHIADGTARPHCGNRGSRSPSKRPRRRKRRCVCSLLRSLAASYLTPQSDLRYYIHTVRE